MIRLKSPKIENPLFIKKCSGFIEDFQFLLEDHGVSFDDVYKISLAYDSLRQERKQQSYLIDSSDNDIALYDYFQT